MRQCGREFDLHYQPQIDRFFVLDLLANPNDAVIARAIIAPGRGLGLRVMAEVVETASQRDFLFEHGCQSSATRSAGQSRI